MKGPNTTKKNVKDFEMNQKVYRVILILNYRCWVWGFRIVWCTLTSWYLVSLLSVSIIHVSVILLVGFWSWEISFIMWGCQGWGWQAAGTWVSVSRQMVGFPAPIGWPGASQSICTQYKPAGELKSPRAPKFEQKPAPFVPIELL